MRFTSLGATMLREAIRSLRDRAREMLYSVQCDRNKVGRNNRF
jgi:hypothetical protein